MRKTLFREFLPAEKTRELIAYQISNDKVHNGDYWHYYGNPEYWIKDDYADHSWKYRAEFHYFEKLDVNNIEVVLWPIWKEFRGDKESLSESVYVLEVLKKELPDFKFIPYELNTFSSEISFITDLLQKLMGVKILLKFFKIEIIF